MAALGDGARIIGAQGSGASYWTRTARLDAVLPGDPEREESFFLKVD